MSQGKPQKSAAKPQFSQADKTEMANTPCRFYFGQAGECRYADQCFYSHDQTVYNQYHGLHECPNGCGNWCKGAQCRECHLQWQAEKEQADYDYQLQQQQRFDERAQRRAYYDSLPEKKCEGMDCEKKTKYQFCKECKAVNDRYVIRRR